MKKLKTFLLAATSMFLIGSAFAASTISVQNLGEFGVTTSLPSSALERFNVGPHNTSVPVSLWSGGSIDIYSESSQRPDCNFAYTISDESAVKISKLTCTGFAKAYVIRNNTTNPVINVAVVE